MAWKRVVHCRVNCFHQSELAVSVGKVGVRDLSFSFTKAATRKLLAGREATDENLPKHVPVRIEQDSGTGFIRFQPGEESVDFYLCRYGVKKSSCLSLRMTKTSLLRVPRLHSSVMLREEDGWLVAEFMEFEELAVEKKEVRDVL